MSLILRDISQDWEKASILPIFRKDKEKDPENYWTVRPVVWLWEGYEDSDLGAISEYMES